MLFTLKNRSFDFAYSKGALLPTTRTEKPIEKMYRAQKPSAKILNILYERDSFQHYLKVRLLSGFNRSIKHLVTGS